MSERERNSAQVDAAHGNQAQVLQHLLGVAIIVVRCTFELAAVFFYLAQPRADGCPAETVWRRPVTLFAA